MTKKDFEEVHRDAGDLRTKISIQPVSVFRLRRLLTKANQERDRRWRPHSIVKYCEDEVTGFNRLMKILAVPEADFRAYRTVSIRHCAVGYAGACQAAGMRWEQ